ncbi:MAG TPA: PAS domain S-box protein, partial [Geobacteraceae bacterium]
SGQVRYMLDLPREARQTVLSGTPALVDVAVPAMIGGHHVGWARVGIGQKAAGEKLAEITRNGAVYALAAILIGSLIAWLMGRRLTDRLYAVQETIDKVRSGNRLTRSSLAGADEAAVIAREFNSMLDVLAERDTELRDSEERYRSLIRKVQAAIVLHDGQGRILDSNPLAQELLGLSPDQLLGKALIDPEWHFLREDGSVLPVAKYPASLVLSTRQPLRDHVTGISRPDRGDVAWVLINAEPEYDDTGEIALVIVSFVDITKRKRAEEDLAERVMLAELSAEIGYSLTKQGNLRSILNTCAEVLVRRLDVAFVRIWTLNADENVLELQASAGMYTSMDGSHSRVTVGKFKIGLIAEERKPHITNAVIGDPLVHDQEWAKREGMVAFAGYPLIIEDKLVGVMAMFSRKPLTDVTIKALAPVSNEITIGIERMRADEALHRLNRELRAISDCNLLLMRAEDEQALLNDICRIVCDEAGYRMAWVGYAENDNARTVRPVAWAGVEEGYLEQAGFTWADTERGRGPAGTAIRSGESACIQDFTTDPQVAPWRESALQRGCRSSIALPLKDEGANTFGILNIYSIKPNAFTPDEIRLLEELAGNLAFGIMVLRARIERRQAEEALREGEAFLNTLLNAIPIPVFYKDRDGRYLGFNRAYETFFGATRDQLIGKTVFDISPRELAESYRAKDTELFESGEVQQYESQVKNTYGVQRDVIFNKAVFTDSQGTVIGLIGAILDITERKRVEEEIRNLNEELEERVKRRTAELEAKIAEIERLNKVFIGREIRMVELKEKIRELGK